MKRMEDQASGALVDDDLQELEERARPFRALYEHWDRSQWAVRALDLSTDAASFARLASTEQQGMLWIFAHRFHAEFNVATLLGPFLAAAPSYDMQLMLSTQAADEHRHLQCVLRIYDEVFRVKGGIQAVQALADQNMDPVSSLLYGALDGWVGELSNDRSEDAFLRAVVAYHLLGEGVVARTAQNLAVGQYEKLGFPGLAEGQRLVARDEARHIGIGVSYTRSRLTEDRERSLSAITEVLDQFANLAAKGLELGRGLEDRLMSGYGVDSGAFHAEAMRLLQLRLRSIGYLED
jgi:ribonucleotide reductase beta subunit family protein with ferritin-like domain